MKEKSQDACDEHPWIREARQAKEDKTVRGQDNGDDVQYPEPPKRVPYWIPIFALCIMLTLAGVSLRLAFVGQSNAVKDLPPVLHLWHYGSDSETRLLQGLADEFAQTTGISMMLSTYDPRTQPLMNALYATDGPDILIVDSILAQQLAHSNAILTLDGRSPLYRIPEMKDYFLPLTSSGDFNRPLGLVIPRRTRAVHLTNQLIAYIRAVS